MDGPKSKERKDGDINLSDAQQPLWLTRRMLVSSLEVALNAWRA